MTDERFVLALAGGVGGGKFCRGLAAVLPPEQLAIVVNTADDFVHLGLHISPDIDSVLYALADLNDLGARLGPRRRNLEFHGGAGAARRRDLVQARRPRSGDACPADRGVGRRPHACRRSRRCSRAASASPTRSLPMTDDAVRSVVDTDEGALDFQDYFVRRQCQPQVSRRDVPRRGERRAERRLPPGARPRAGHRHHARRIRSSASIRSWRCRASRTHCANRDGRSSRCRRSSAARR